jgi:hypothetical protein
MAVVDVMVYTQRCNAVPRDLLDNLIYIYIYINPSLHENGGHNLGTCYIS